MQPRRVALDALCRRIVPAAYQADPPVDIVSFIEQRIASMDPPLRRDLNGALQFFDHPVTGMLLSGRPRRFSTLPPAEQDAFLREWERSALALRRTVFQALRRLILATYYSLPEAHAEIGFLRPLFQREPLFPWEGPAPEAAPADEPVARVNTPLRAAPPPRPAGVTEGMAVPRDTVLRADACVIGSGAGGAVVAARLAEAGHDVVVLEEGGFYTGADFDDNELRLAPLLYADGAARATDDLSVIILQGRCAGGGSTVNWMMTLHPRPWVMHEWEHDYGVELLSARILEPAMCAMEEAIHARPVPEDAHSPSNRVILEGCARLNWQTIEAKINARDCVRAGSCGLGCRWGAKQSAGAVFLPRALAAGARLLCDTRADRIELIERGGNAPLKRVHATIIERNTREARGALTIEAPIVVSAAGAVGTPALFERSGLGGGAVGRWLRLHPTTAVFGIYPQAMYGAAGIPQSAVCSEFLRSDNGYGFWIECPPLRPGLAAAALQGFGEEHRDNMLSFRRLGALIVLVRDGAQRDRSSGDVRVDRHGRIRIRYRVSPPDRRQLTLGVQAAARLHLAMEAEHALTLHVGATPLRTEADVGRLARNSYDANRISLFSAHVNGTCRMGRDARDAGCSPAGERFGTPGLYVADGSLFPTAPGVNPQLAIMALSSLIADRIIESHYA